MAAADAGQQADLVVRRLLRAVRGAAPGIGMHRLGAHIFGAEIDVFAITVRIEIAGGARRSADLVEEEMAAAIGDAAAEPAIDAGRCHAAKLDETAAPATFDALGRTTL